MGNSSGEFLAISSVLRFSRTIAAEAIISDTTRPAPPRFTIWRKGMSVTPDMRCQDDGVLDADGTDVDRVESRVRFAISLAQLIGILCSAQ